MRKYLKLTAFRIENLGASDYGSNSLKYQQRGFVPMSLPASVVGTEGRRVLVFADDDKEAEGHLAFSLNGSWSLSLPRRLRSISAISRAASAFLLNFCTLILTGDILK